MKKWTLLATFIVLLAMLSLAQAQDPGTIAVTFDEAGTVIRGNFADLGVPDAAFPTTHIHVFVVAFGIVDISGYEFSLIHTGAAPAVITKILYGPAPVDQGGDDYDVRAETGGCVTDAAAMGSDPNSWTLCDFDFNYFSDPGREVYYCVEPSSSAAPPAAAPVYSGCDNVQHEMPPAYEDSSGNLPGGCGVLNMMNVGDETPSWGSLKVSY